MTIYSNVLATVAVLAVGVAGCGGGSGSASGASEECISRVMINGDSRNQAVSLCEEDFPGIESCIEGKLGIGNGYTYAQARKDCVFFRGTPFE